MKILRENQERVDKVMATLTPISQEDWESQTVTELYTMESQIFDYDQILTSEMFGIK
jgi:hypothetical protein